MIDNSISILGQVISIILGMFSTYIVLNFIHNFKIYLILFCQFLLWLYYIFYIFIWINLNDKI